MTGKKNVSHFKRRALGLAVFALLLAGVPAAQAVTQQASFQVRAFVLASCALSANAIAPQMPTFVACQSAPELSPILAAAPRAILLKDDTNGQTVLTMEF